MVCPPDSLIPNVAQLPDSLDRSGLGLEAGEGFDGRVEVGLRFDRSLLRTPSILGDGRPASEVGVVGLDGIDHELLDERGLDGDPLRAVGVAAAVHGVFALPEQPEGGAAGGTPQEAKAGEQPRGSAMPLPPHGLSSLPCGLVNQGLMGVEVDQLPEVNLPPVDAGAEHGLDAGVGLLDPLVGEEGADLGKRCSRYPHMECVGDCRGYCVVYDEPPFGSTDIADRDSRVGEDAPLHGERLSRPASLLDRAPVILRDNPQHGPADPLGGGGFADLSDVGGKDATAGILHSLDDLRLDDERAEQAVEVGDHYDLRSVGFYSLDSGSQALSLGEGRPTGNVDLLMDGEQFQGLPLADSFDPFALLLGANRVLSTPRLPDDSDGSDAAAPYPIRWIGNNGATIRRSPNDLTPANRLDKGDAA